MDAPLGRWIEGICALGSPVVGLDEGLVGCGAVLEWACLDTPVDGLIKCIVVLDILLVGYDKDRGGLGALLEWAKARGVLLLISPSKSGWYRFALFSF